MKIVLKFYFISVLIFVYAIEIDGCSKNVSDIISLIEKNPNFEYDPCYIQWKADHDFNLEELKLQHNLERRNANYEPQELVKGYSSYLTEKLNKTKEAPRESTWKPYQELSFRRTGFLLLLLLCFAFCGNKTCRKACVNNREPDIDTGELTVISITQSPITALQNPTDANVTTPGMEVDELNQYQRDLDSHGYQSASNIPLLPMGVKRHSLPSYDDAIKMSPSLADLTK